MAAESWLVEPNAEAKPRDLAAEYVLLACNFAEALDLIAELQNQVAELNLRVNNLARGKNPMRMYCGSHVELLNVIDGLACIKLHGLPEPTWVDARLVSRPT